MSKRAKGKAAAATPPPRASTPRRKVAKQVAALCLEPGGDRLLLITSRDTGRWVIPKGWPMRKRSLPGTALREAWEEAGVQGSAGRKELGRYYYDKRRDHGFAVPVEVRVYGILVRALADSFPEVGQRERRWFTPEEAAGLVAEEGLQQLIGRVPKLVADGVLRLIEKGK